MTCFLIFPRGDHISISKFELDALQNRKVVTVIQVTNKVNSWGSGHTSLNLSTSTYINLYCFDFFFEVYNIH